MASETILYTIGHSNQPLEKFLSILQQNHIKVLVDVRSYPMSEYASQFDKGTIETPLKNVGIRYLYLGKELGGRPDEDQFFDGEGHVLYGKVAASEPFLAGIKRLIAGIAEYRVAIMCSEEDPTNCHRRLLVSRVLAQKGIQVLHLRASGQVQTDDEVKAADPIERKRRQMDLFEQGGDPPWKSTQSVLRKKPQNSSLA